MTYRKKLIEVALPLEAINKESSREKSIRHGHPSTLHIWWSRKPLATCRAVLFASLVDDPSAWPELFPTEEDQEAERQRLFRIIEELVKWESTTNQTVLLASQTEIARSIARNRGEDMPGGTDSILKYIEENAPPVLDPFCGGGSIPLEAQRLGLRTYASDLNPVAVLITKALVEIPPKFTGRPPVNPEARSQGSLIDQEWRGAEGLSEDIRYYGKWVRVEAEKRIGQLFPKIKVTKEMAQKRSDLKQYVGKELTIVAWKYCRTVPSPDPAVHGAHVPLTTTFWLSKKRGNETYIYPTINRNTNTYSFEIRPGNPKDAYDPSNGTRVGRATFRCILSGTNISGEYIDEQASLGRMSSALLAVIVKGDGHLLYLSPGETLENGIISQIEVGMPQETPLSAPARGTFAGNAQGRRYGFLRFTDYFTPRQLASLITFCDLVNEVKERVQEDVKGSSTLHDEYIDPSEYSDAIITYLAFVIDKCTDYWCTLATWMPRETVGHAFSTQGISMVWDYPETNPFAEFHCSWDEACGWVAKAVARLPHNNSRASAYQLDASVALRGLSMSMISTDPPYYDNIGYADLSDYFYVWLRRSLSQTYPDLFATLLTPKSQELIASQYRHEGDSEKARLFFEYGLGEAFSKMRKAQHSQYPLTLFYAFKQAENRGDTDDPLTVIMASTGWETMLNGLISSGFSIHGTWPMRSERSARSVAIGANALASSIVLVCRPRPEDAPMTTRRDFISELKKELPNALVNLQHGNIAPVDLAQASIGPGMAVFTRYSKVMEADGSRMTVRAALALINQTLDEVLAEQEGEFDSDTRWAVAWFEQFGMEEGPFGVAETLSKAKDTAVSGMVEAGILYARGGKVRLLKREELQEGWDPATDSRFTIWESTQHLIRALDQQGEQVAAELLRKLGAIGESARDLAYRLYNICERKKWAQEALAYNSLVIAWPEISRLAQGTPSRSEAQTGMFESE